MGSPGERRWQHGEAIAPRRLAANVQLLPSNRGHDQGRLATGGMHLGRPTQFVSSFDEGLEYENDVVRVGIPETPNFPIACLNGYVWREAVPGDYVCVTPAARTQAAYDNSQAAARRNPSGGSYGPDTCREGYVWREAVPNDHVCVTFQTRQQAADDNRLAQSRRVGP
jgi:hypothetical protein